MKDLFGNKIFWGCLISIVLVVSYFGLDQNGKRLEAEKAKKGALATATTDAKLGINGDVAQQIIPLQKGNMPDYSTPTPTPPPPPPPEKHKIKSLPPLILVDTTPTPTPTPRAEQPAPRRWLSESMYIPCVLLPELDSGHGAIYIVCIVTENIYCLNYGVSNLILPAGTRLMSQAEGGYRRDRIFADIEWTAIFNHSGISVKFKGALCDMEYDVTTNMYGLYDKSPGIQGKLVETDQYARLEGFFELLLKTGSNLASSAGDSILQRGLQGGGGSNNVQVNVPPVDPLIDSSIKLLVNGHHTDINDTLMVRVPSGKTCWVLTLGPVYVDLASVGSSLQAEQEKKAEPDDTQKAVNQLQAIQAKYEKNEDNTNSDK